MDSLARSTSPDTARTTQSPPFKMSTIAAIGRFFRNPITLVVAWLSLSYLVLIPVQLCDQSWASSALVCKNQEIAALGNSLATLQQEKEREYLFHWTPPNPAVSNNVLDLFKEIIAPLFELTQLTSDLEALDIQLSGAFTTQRLKSTVREIVSPNLKALGEAIETAPDKLFFQCGGISLGEIIDPKSNCRSICSGAGTGSSWSRHLCYDRPYKSCVIDESLEEYQQAALLKLAESAMEWADEALRLTYTLGNANLLHLAEDVQFWCPRYGQSDTTYEVHPDFKNSCKAADELVPEGQSLARTIQMHLIPIKNSAFGLKKVLHDSAGVDAIRKDWSTTKAVNDLRAVFTAIEQTRVSRAQHAMALKSKEKVPVKEL